MTTAGNDVTVDTQHTDAVHDAQFDYYGRFLATCASDRAIRIFSLNSQPPTLIATLNGHEGPVWMVAWAHPRFGTALASAGYDGKAVVWKEGASATSPWRPSTVITAHSASVNAVAWAPHEFGAVLASAGADGNVFLTAAEGNTWREPISLSPAKPPHPMGAMGVSFAPMQTAEDRPLLASCGCDGSVKVWRASSAVSSVNGAAAQWQQVSAFNDHRDWVRDVAFSPDAGSAFVILASCSQDKTVILRRRRRDADDAAPWETSKPTTFADVVFRLSWNPTGTSLLVTTGDSNAFVLTPGAAFADEWLRAPVSSVDGDLSA